MTKEKNISNESRKGAKDAKIFTGIRRSGFSREFYYLTESLRLKPLLQYNINVFASFAPWRE